jgi:hypothetical protein
MICNHMPSLSQINVSRSVVIDVMFNTLVTLFIASERTKKNNCWKTMDAGKLFISNYLGRIIWKLSIQGQLFFRIMNYQGFRNNQVKLYELFLLGM